MSQIERTEPVALAIEEGRPLVLLLGQEAWSTSARPDPGLVAALKRSDQYSDESVRAGFHSLIRGGTVPEALYTWLAEFYERQPVPEWIEPVSLLLWNAVFTTHVDPTLTRTLRIHGRDVETVLTKDDNPVAPRDRRRLHVTHLFGRAGEATGHGAPPGTLQDLRKRAALHAMPLLARIVETTTPLGILLIDGFSCGKDWLSTESLVGTLSAFRSGQVFWFGWDPETQTPEARRLVEELAEPKGPIVLVPTRLATALRTLELAHRIDLSTSTRVVSEGVVSIGERTLELPSATKLKTSTGGAIVDDTWLAPLAPLGLDAEYAEFRRFHGQVEDARRLFDGIRRGFAIRREFEVSLVDRVRAALNSAGRTREPVLVHGQSGSGKSVALVRLAQLVREEGRYPVLLSSRATRVPAVDELDEFCLLAEDVGASAILIICDANAPPSRYRDLLRGFKSRGRAVVVVGSAYRLSEPAEDNKESSGFLLEAPVALSTEESRALEELLRRFTGLTSHVQMPQDLLPAVYRLLPEVRPRLAAGLAKEARAAEEVLRTRGGTTEAAPPAAGTLAQALIDAGLASPRKFLEERIEEFLGSLSDAASRAIDLVMVAGKLGCPVPVDILMRAAGGTENRSDIASLFAGIDLFRWSSDERADVFIHPRLRLEAELICARRLGTSRAEAEVAIKLLSNANPTTYDSSERRFVLDMVHRLGPDGPYGQRYAGHYLEVARALTDLRRTRGVTDPSLMLQEATLRRRLFRDAPSLLGVDPAAVLEEAREVVDLALDTFGASRSAGLRRMCANLKVERAAIYGFRAVQRLRQAAPLDEVWQFYMAARDSARSAIYAADTYYATDVSIWVPNDLLRDAQWSDERRAELVADIWDALERVDPDQLDPDQREQYEARRVKVAQTLENKKMEEDALAALEIVGSRAGLFLTARRIGGALRGVGAPGAEDVERAAAAAAYLDERREAILDDGRCLRYLLRCRWVTWTKSFLFAGERAPLPAEDRDLRALLELVEQLRLVEGALGDARTSYLQAVLQYRLLREHDARMVWQELSRDTDYSDSRRVIRQHVWTDAAGLPVLFHGRISGSEPERRRFRVRVEEIRQEVDLLQRDFHDLDLRPGGGVPGGFHIAFNFIGPVADRPGRRGGVR